MHAALARWIEKKNTLSEGYVIVSGLYDLTEKILNYKPKKEYKKNTLK